jgi:hypothetical protein
MQVPSSGAKALRAVVRAAGVIATDGDSSDHWPLIPFSAGPAGCPGRRLVLLLTSALLATLFGGQELRQVPPKALDGAAPLPATLSPFDLRFEFAG